MCHVHQNQIDTYNLSNVHIYDHVAVMAARCFVSVVSVSTGLGGRYVPATTTITMLDVGCLTK